MDFDCKLTSYDGGYSIYWKREGADDYTIFFETPTRLYDRYNVRADRLVERVTEWIDLHGIGACEGTINAL